MRDIARNRCDVGRRDRLLVRSEEPARLNAHLVGEGLRVDEIGPYRRTLEQVVLDAGREDDRGRVDQDAAPAADLADHRHAHRAAHNGRRAARDTDLGPRPGTGPPFLSVLSDGTLFPLAALGVVPPLLLPIAVAVLGGDAIAGESQTGTLRYLLVRPVGRTHLLLAKLVTVVAFVLLAVLVVAAVSYAEGRLLLGRAPATGTVSLSGSTLTQQELAWRTALALGYVIISMLGVAAVALFFST